MSQQVSRSLPALETDDTGHNTQHESIVLVWRTTGEVGEEVSRVKKTPFEEVSEEAPSRNLTELQGEPQRAKEEV